MGLDDFLGWQERKLTKGRARPKPRPEPTENDVKPSEPISVHEHHASTTIIEKLYAVLGKRSYPC